jgi:short-chain fatty acids transporter
MASNTETMEKKGRMERFADAAERLVPDAISSAVFMVLILFVFALSIGVPAEKAGEAYYKGFWMLLAFTMQMTLIITLSAVFGQAPLFRKIIMYLAAIPKTPFQVVAVATLLTCVLAYFYWGLAITLGPVIAVYFCGEAEKKGIKVDFMVALATVFAAHSVWQYGMSSSAPLLSATPGHFLEKTTGQMALSTTIWSPAAIVYIISFAILLLVVSRLLFPKNPKTIAAYPDATKLVEDHQAEALAREVKGDLTFSQRLERSSFMGYIVILGIVIWLYYHFKVKNLGLDLNSLNAIFLALCFILHRSVFRFTEALKEGIKSSWSVVVIYHMYALAAGILQFTPAGEFIAKWLGAIATPYTYPLMMAISGTIIAIFVPSSGGQWVIQGFVTSKAAETIGVSFQRGMMSLGIGDQMGNLCSPFWYVIVAGIARVDFRKFFGYGLVFAALWFILGVICFTFLPC